MISKARKPTISPIACVMYAMRKFWRAYEALFPRDLWRTPATVLWSIDRETERANYFMSLPTRGRKRKGAYLDWYKPS